MGLCISVAILFVVKSGLVMKQLVILAIPFACPCSIENENRFLNCSNVVNFQAFFWVSAMSGGRMPFQKESIPSVK